MQNRTQLVTLFEFPPNYLSSEVCIEGAIHLTHPAGAELRTDLESPDTSTGRETHWIVGSAWRIIR